MPAVSVVIPVFNGARTISRAIDSVLAQRDVDLEILVCDDGSTDGTAAALARYGDRLTVIAQPNRGRGAARNVCLDRATAPLVALLDADDWWVPGKLRAQLASAARHPECDVFFANAYVTKTNDIVYRALNGEWNVAHSGQIFQYLVRQNFVPTSTILARRSVLERIGGFDVELKRCQDLDWLLRVAVASLFHYDAVPLAYYDSHSWGTDEKETVTPEYFLRLLAKTEANHPELAVRYHARFAKTYSDCYYRLGEYAVSRGEHARAAGYFQAALAHTPAARVVLRRLGLAQYHAGQYPESIDTFTRFLEGDPYQTDAHFYVGNAWLAQGDAERARGCFEDALYGGYQNQKFPECVNNLGVTFARAGHVERARELWAQALEQHPFYTDAITNLHLPREAATNGAARWTTHKVF
jgi:glycosyltransferase involved in cell wall biosynthesis